MNMISILILLMLWLISLFIAFESGVNYYNISGRLKRKKILKCTAASEPSREELEENNFYSYNGREQEPLN